MIDLHTHILFGVDDGPVDVAGSVAFARAALADGTTTIAATPHVDAHFGRGPADFAAPLAAVRAALAEEGVGVEVVAGAEVAMERCLGLEPAELDALTLGAGPYLLLEAPLSPATGAFDRFAATLLARGRRLLIAHPERCPAFQRRPDRLADLVAAGALAQVTGASLAGRFGRTVRAAAVGMLERGLVHDLASDGHHATERPPGLREGLEHAARALPGASALADWLTVDVPRAILDGAPHPPRPALPVPPPRRGLRGRLRPR